MGISPPPHLCIWQRTNSNIQKTSIICLNYSIKIQAAFFQNKMQKFRYVFKRWNKIATILYLVDGLQVDMCLIVFFLSKHFLILGFKHSNDRNTLKYQLSLNFASIRCKSDFSLFFKKIVHCPALNLWSESKFHQILLNGNCALSVYSKWMRVWLSDM